MPGALTKGCRSAHHDNCICFCKGTVHNEKPRGGPGKQWQKRDRDNESGGQSPNDLFSDFQTFQQCLVHFCFPRERQARTCFHYQQIPWYNPSSPTGLSKSRTRSRTVCPLLRRNSISRNSAALFPITRISESLITSDRKSVV